MLLNKKKKSFDQYDKKVDELKSKEKEVKKKLSEEKNLDKVDKKRLKQLEADMKKRKKAKSSIPKTTQQSIPYIADYEDGMFEIEPNRYSKCIDFSDVNYQVAKESDKINIFTKWGEALNYFNSDVDMSFTINNRLVNMEQSMKNIKIPLQNNECDNYINEFNRMLYKQFTTGRNDIQREKYMTITINADSPYEALSKFNKIENDVCFNLARTGSVTSVQTTERRLSILHDFFRPENVGELSLDWNNLKSQGLSSKDYIAPFGMKFKSDYFKIDDKYCRCVYINNIPSTMSDEFLSDITDFSFPLMCTVSAQSVALDKAIKMIKHQITGMEAMKIESQKKAVKAGYDPELSISHELKYSYAEAEKLLANVQTNNEQMFYVTFCIMYTADSLQELEEEYLSLSSVARKHLCQIQKMKYQQEDGMKQVLPLGHRILPLKRTLTTVSLGIFIPFTSQELLDDNGIYYSLNSLTKNLIMVRRKRLNNPNGFVLGESGCGKSFVVKKEIIAKYLALPNEQIYIVDPEGEYARLVTKLGGQIVKISVGSDTFINLMDMDKNYSQDGDMVAEKADYLLSICDSIAKGLTPAQRTIIDRVTNIVYLDYVQGFDEEKLPTFVDFYNLVKQQGEKEAQDLALALETYAKGSLSIFAKKTNVNLNNRLVCFDISGLSKNLQDLGLLVVSELIWNKLCANRNKISTSVYIDEFHLMFKNETSENFADQLYARIRKYGGEVTGITQNVDTLLKSEKARGMLSNSLFTIMLSQSDYNRKILADMFSIGEEQLSYITNADKGHGLIRAGGVIVPFGDAFPKDTQLYRMMTSDPEEIKRFDMEDEQREKSKKLENARKEKLSKQSQPLPIANVNVGGNVEDMFFTHGEE